MATLSQALIDRWSDPRWRLNNLYRIIDKEGREVPFRMNWAQESLFDEMHHLNIILKARQLGFTTIYCLYMLDACLFSSNTSAGVVAHNLDDAENFFREKIKFPYDNLPEQLKDRIPATRDAAKSLAFGNGSSIRVGTSLRSGTLQYLLISEYGKICAKFPEKAREIRTGALNTIQSGQSVAIESTAEGRGGDFFQMCQDAQKKAQADTYLTPMDFKFHFFPWFLDPAYSLDPDTVQLTEDDEKYFAALRADHKVELTAGQMAWYVKKRETQMEEMKREYPSTSDEAFEAAIRGSYFATQMRIARKQGRVAPIPIETRLPVNTFWDLGYDDAMAIWFHQQFGQQHRFVGYYENRNEGFAHYARKLKEWSAENDVTFGEHFGPHDIEVHLLDAHATTRKEQAASVGIKFETVPRIADKMDAIELARSALSSSWLDSVKCSLGIQHLDNYQTAWDEVNGVPRSAPLKNDAVHGADAFQTFAQALDAGMLEERKGPLPQVTTDWIR